MTDGGKRVAGSLRALTLICTGLLALMSGCGHPAPSVSLDPGKSTTDRSVDSPAKRGQVKAPVRLKAQPANSDSPVSESLDTLPEVVFHTDRGEVRVRLRPDRAPATVEHFLQQCVERSLYDGTIFHHVERGFIVAGGGFNTALEARPSPATLRNEAARGLKNRRGTLAMARDPQSADSAASQFFFNLADNRSLDYQSHATPQQTGYCAFGEVIEGWEVLEQIAEQPTQPQGDFPHLPVEPCLIQSVERVR